MSSTAQDLAITSQAKATLFSHPDDTSYVDGLDDPVRTVAELQKLGPIIRGESLQTGYMMRFGDVILPNMLTSPQRLEHGVFAALTWEAGRAVYMDPARFSSSALSETSGKNWGHGSTDPYEVSHDCTKRIHAEDGCLLGRGHHPTNPQAEL